MIRIGVTGEMGSGKSYVCQEIQRHYGFPIYDSDSKAKILMTQDALLVQQLKTLLGIDAYTPDGQLNKFNIAQKIFANEELLNSVNKLVHPCITADFIAWAKQQTSKAVVVESAVLLSCPLAQAVDVIIEVVAPKSVRIARAMARDHASQSDVEARLQYQHTSTSQTNYLIENDGIQPIAPQLYHIIRQLNLL